jgi:hypothetical protein
MTDEEMDKLAVACVNIMWAVGKWIGRVLIGLALLSAAFYYGVMHRAH